MRLIFDDQEHWYSLFDDGGTLVLDVVAGTTALYNVPRRLTPVEQATYEREGRPYLTRLAAEVVRDPAVWVKKSQGPS